MSDDWGATKTYQPDSRHRTSAATTSATVWIKNRHSHAVKPVPLQNAQDGSHRPLLDWRCALLRVCLAVSIAASGKRHRPCRKCAYLQTLRQQHRSRLLSPMPTRQAAARWNYTYNRLRHTKDIATRVLSDMGTGGVDYRLDHGRAALPAGTQLTTTQID